MKNLSLIYNPASGDKNFPKRFDELFEIFQNGGYAVHPRRLQSPEDMNEYISGLEADRYDAICVCGGDGTINLAANAMIKNGVDLPLGIMPSGTANDFATFLGIPRDYAKAAEIIVTGNTIDADVGSANGEIFVNVCAGGALSGVSQDVDSNLKNSIGKLAYYLKGLGELQKFRPIPLKITTPDTTVEQMFFMFLALNSSGTGGFRELSAEASITDGLLEFIGIKACPLTDVVVLFMRMLANPKDYLNDSNIVYLRSSEFQISSRSRNAKYLSTDIDGERGPDLPLTIKILPGGLRFFK